MRRSTLSEFINRVTGRQPNPTPQILPKPAYPYPPDGSGNGPIGVGALSYLDKAFLYNLMHENNDPGVYARVLNASKDEINELINEVGNNAARAAQYPTATYNGFLRAYV